MEDEDRDKTIPCNSFRCRGRILPTDNIFAISCRLCLQKYCQNCGQPPHFPITCEERQRWEEREFVEDPSIITRVKSTEAYLAIFDTLSRNLLRCKDDLEERCFQKFSQFPDLENLHIEMESIISFCKWLQVLLCFTPRLIPLASNAFNLVTVRFSSLYDAYPYPDRPDLWDNFREPRASAAEAMVALLTSVRNTGLSDRMLHGSYEPAYTRSMGIAFSCELRRWRKICPKPQRPRVEVIKLKATAFWVVDHGTCSVCRILLLDKCLMCQADRAIGECPVVRGVCNHAFHLHCVRNWLTAHNSCPLDHIEWQA